jgi:lipopolysaccharide/colanic/teichoic acid biosynthesis glycosyltransferase
MSADKRHLFSALRGSPMSAPDSRQPDQSNGITSERAFLDILHREVRRTERSGRPLVLALIKSDLDRAEIGRPTATALAAAVKASIRETDWMGWYEHNKVLGIAFTELGEPSDAKIAVLVQKLSRAIRDAVGPEEFDSFKLLLRLFPEDPRCHEDAGSGEGSYQDLHCRRNPPSAEVIIKRAADIAGSLFGIVLFSPLFLILIVLVKLTSSGPVFYRQKRVGQHGSVFDFYKFRSMYEGNDTELHREFVTRLIENSEDVRQANGMYKIINDPRITPIGRLLRKSSLDELPQFLNVLIGDMSLVGPRPPLPYEFERYRPWHRRRVLDVKPGLTGLWQVKGRSRTTFEEMVRMDLLYLRKRSLWLDIKIILQTPVAMFTGTGAS